MPAATRSAGPSPAGDAEANHFANAGKPAHTARAEEYTKGPTCELANRGRKGDESVQTDHMDPLDIGRAVVDLVATPHGKRPFRVTVDPTDGGADEINKIGDRLHAAYLTRAGMGDVLHPTKRN